MRTLILTTALAASLFLNLNVTAADADKDFIKDLMKKYHKAPQGQDPVCKKAADAKASKEELKELVAAYTKLAKAKAPKGDAASWKEKTTALLTAAEGMQKGTADAVTKYKDAVNCKACHSAHKPD